MKCPHRSGSGWCPPQAMAATKSSKAQASMLFIVTLLMIVASQCQDSCGWFALATSSSTSREVPGQNWLAAAAREGASQASEKQNTTTAESQSQSQSLGQQHRLSCQPGEQRQFSYESSTRVWGSSDQQVRLRATLRLKCMEPPTNTTLKYLAEIVALAPDFMHRNEPVSQKLQVAPAAGAARPKQPAGTRSARTLATAAELANLQDGHNPHTAATQLRWAPLHAADGAGRRSQAADREAKIDQMLRAEPLLEEMGDAATRMGRSISGWFSKAWVSVKDFFGNIFTSSERSSVSRDQAFRESGLDIMGQCKAPSTKGRNPSGLPFDESVFEDLGPEYYVGASLDGSSGSGFEFASSGHAPSAFNDRAASHDDSTSEEEDELALNLSFFDDPSPTRVRARRAASSSSSSPSGKKSTRAMQDSQAAPDYNRLLRIPFVFMQSRAGKIIEIRFSGEESDLSVKNFKRHLCDLFATNLDWNRTNQNEVSPIGKHQTKYQLDASANSIDSIKESALKLASSSNDEERSNKQQLVRVLAMVGTNDRNFLQEASDGGNRTLVDDDDDDDYVDLDGSVHGDGPNSTTKASDMNEHHHSHDRPKSISVLRTINTTSSIQLSSKMLSPDIDRIQVRVKQVQQIDAGRLVGTAGQLSMSLVQMMQQPSGDSGGGSARSKRETSSGDGAQMEDISDLLKLSTSFSMQLVPIPRNPDGSIDDGQDSSSSLPVGTASKATGRSAGNRWRREAKAGPTVASPEKTRQKRGRKSTLVRQPPNDPQELQRVLQEWRKQEARLQLSSSNLVAEHSGLQESQQTRLDILRDLIRQRLNEEFVRNRIRRSLNEQQQMAALSQQARGDEHGEPPKVEPTKQPVSRSGAGGDLGLGLTQLVLSSGVTSKRKGSIYATIEEAMELESRLEEDHKDVAISRLLRDTIRMDKLKQHCKSAIPSLEELAAGSQPTKRAAASNLHIERRLPFGFKADDNDDGDDSNEENSETGGESASDHGQHHSKAAAISERRRQKRRSLVKRFERQNDRKLEQCQNVLQLMLELDDRQAVDLTIDLIDECNQRLVAAAKQEELGYGPMSKLYRRLRQRFIETLAHTSKPSDALLDKLLARLYYPKMGLEPASSNKQQGSGRNNRRPHQSRTSTPEPPEFVYVNKQGSKEGVKYNKSLLKDEDDFNNRDGAALLVMSITSLAAKSCVSRPKRVEIAERLLQSLRGTTCSLFNSPDLDIIESMSSFQEPLDEIVGRILQLARKCKQHDQYVVAAVHGLSGQLQHAGSQRFLVDLLKSQNASCTVKSEIVLTLIGVQLANDLKQFSSANQSDQSQATSQWPNSGLNKVDETLLELVDSVDKQHEPDRRCLKQLVAHYLSKKHQSGAQQGSGSSASNGAPAGSTTSKQQRSSRSHPGDLGGAAVARHRGKRAIRNEHNFWDEAQCKRWTVPVEGISDLGSIFGPANQSFSNFYSTHNTDLIDEIDDNSIVTALMHSSHNKTSGGGVTARGARRNQKLIERELDSNGPNSTSTSSQAAGGGAQTTHSTHNSNSNFLRKRHKCVASKDFGPKNAQANLKAEIVNDLIGSMDENKFLARFRLSTSFLGNRIDVGRMYLWHQRRTTRAYANILGRSIWDSSHGCKDRAPNQVLYMPLFDFNLWLVKVSVGLRLNAEMGFFPNCDPKQQQQHHHQNSNGSSSGAGAPGTSSKAESARVELNQAGGSGGSAGHIDELQLYPTVLLKAAGEATAKLVVARAGMSLASQYSYQGDIRVSRQPESCMSVYSSHQPMNITFSSWFQLWDNDCHFWGSRGRAEPQAIKWRLTGRKPIAWLEDECLAAPDGSRAAGNSTLPADERPDNPMSARSVAVRANRIDP